MGTASLNGVSDSLDSDKRVRALRVSQPETQEGQEMKHGKTNWPVLILGCLFWIAFALSTIGFLWNIPGYIEARFCASLLIIWAVWETYDDIHENEGKHQ